MASVAELIPNSSFLTPTGYFGCERLSRFSRFPTQINGKVKLTYNGKEAMVAEGSKMSAACSKLGYKPKFSCKK